MMILNTALCSVFMHGALSKTTPETQLQYEKQLRSFFFFLPFRHMTYLQAFFPPYVFRNRTALI